MNSYARRAFGLREGLAISRSPTGPSDLYSGLRKTLGTPVLAGFAFLASAYAIKENRLLNGLVGVGVLALGIAVFTAKCLRIEQVEKLRRLMGRED